MYYCIQQLNNPDLKNNARQMAGILFKNTVLNSTKDIQWEDIWNKMDEEQHETLKDGLLEALGANDEAIVRSAASGISAIWSLEFPKKKWLNVLDTLCLNATNEELSFRFASLQTLGYIWEELMPNDFEKKYSDIIISAFIDSLEKNKDYEKLMEVTIQGIYHSIKFTIEHFREGQGGIILDNILPLTSYPSDTVREIIFQWIVEIVRLCYDYINPFMGEISEVTMNATRQDITKVKTQAIEIWSSIAEEENIKEEKGMKHHNIIDTGLDMLLEMIEYWIKDLNIGNEEWDEDQEWGTSTAAGWWLSLISLVAKDKVVEPITHFVADAINKPKWDDKYWGIVALGAILDGPSKEILYETLTPALPQLIELIDDRHQRVRYAIFWLFSKLAKLIPELIENKQYFETIYIKMINGLSESPKIASNIASIISELSDSLLNKDEIVENSTLSQVYEELLNKLLDFTLRENISSDIDLQRVRVSGFSAMYNLLQYAPRDWENEVMKFMGEIFTMLKNSVNPEISLDSKTMELQGFFLWALQWAITNVKWKIEDELGIKIIDLVIDIFQQRKDILDEGFLVMSAIANKIPKALDWKVDHIASYILFGLRSNNPAIVRNSWGVLSDLCTLVESQSIMKGFTEYMPILLDLLKDKSADKSIKIIVISLIGDTFLYTKKSFQPYLEESLQILESAAQISIKLEESNEDNAEQLNYFSILHSSLIECYTWFVQNISETNEDWYQTLGL